MNELKVKAKIIYGNELIYPACESSELIAKIAGKKTISRHNLSLLEKLGYKIEVISDLKL